MPPKAYAGPAKRRPRSTHSGRRSSREFELLVALEHLVRLVLIHMYEFRADDPLEFANQPVLDALVEEGEIFLPLVQ